MGPVGDVEHERIAMTIHVRPATPADHPVIAALLDVAYAPFAEVSPAYHARVATPPAWADDATEVFVAIQTPAATTATRDRGHDTVVGVVAYATEDSPLHEAVWPPLGDAGFRFLAVDETMRGSGVGGHLVQACIDEATAAGRRRIGIYTMEFMHAAHRLYEHMGFDRRADLDVAFDGGPGRVYTFDLVDDAGAHFPPPGPVPDPLPEFDDVLVAPGDHPHETC